MEHRVRNGDTTISYAIDGPADAPVLLFLNSIGTTKELWAQQAAACNGGFRVIRYDARGHGRSSIPAGDYTIEELGRDALAVLDAERAATAHVCGISLGGLTAMWLGVHAPERLASLTLANTAARIGTVDSWTDRITLVREQGMTAVADRAIPLWFTTEFRERDPQTVHAFRAMLQTCPPEGYLGCCAALRDEDLRESIAQIRCPVLAVGGTHDSPTPLSGMEFIRDRIRGARLVALEAAHLSNVEQADAFTSALLAFLTNV